MFSRTLGATSYPCKSLFGGGFEVYWKSFRRQARENCWELVGKLVAQNQKKSLLNLLPKRVQRVDFRDAFVIELFVNLLDVVASTGG